MKGENAKGKKNGFNDQKRQVFWKKKSTLGSLRHKTLQNFKLFPQWTNTRKLGTKEKIKTRKKREKRSEKAISKMTYLQKEKSSALSNESWEKSDN